jgi:carbon starvation protein
MSALLIISIGFLLFFAGYKIYGQRLEKIFEVDGKRKTPAYTHQDGVDYVPAKNWLILFGHHFASIAGAGPIIGPVIAAVLWGWLPALLWIVFGSIFIGGVHDFSVLMISVRHEGRSIADISEAVISRKARLIFSAFVLLALILVVAVFIYFCAKTFVDEPKIVLPSLGLIPVAAVVGILIYRLNVNTILSTVLGLSCLSGLVFWGDVLPLVIKSNGMLIWSLVLIVYCYIASITPVNILLQPRDYLSSFLLFFSIALGYLGILFSRPHIVEPALISWNTSEGSLWPMLFVTVACGAISGFHALIAGGTTSKQLASELHAKKVGFGAMLVEGFVAMLAVMAVVSLRWFDSSASLASLLKDVGPVGVFGQGFGALSKGLVGRFGAYIALMTLNAFILTTLDTATRITRYILEELTPIKNKYISTLIILIAASMLAISGKWNKIWPAFGASNQLVAALTLLVISSWLLSRKKTFIFAIVPALIMLVTTVAALLVGVVHYARSADFLLLIISLLLVILALTLSYEALKAMKRLLRKG